MSETALQKKRKNDSRAKEYARALYPSMQRSYSKKKKVEVSTAPTLFN